MRKLITFNVHFFKTEDPLDNRYVYVAASGVGDESGEGLFAKSFIPANTTFAQYVGLTMADEDYKRIHEKEVENMKNTNTNQVTPEYERITKYL